MQYDGLDISKKIIDDFIKENSWYKDTLFNQDMKSININNTYNLIILPFNTFCYLYTLNDIRQFFEGINKISDSNTIIIIDIVNYNYDNISDTKKYKPLN